MLYHTVLPTTYAGIHKWNEPESCLPLELHDCDEDNSHVNFTSF